MIAHRDIYDPRASVTDREVSVLGRNGMVVASQPLAAQAGLAILRQGGNAVDAAVAVATTLGVVEPCMSGPMGAGYLLIALADTDEVRCLDFVGPSPAGVGQARPSELMDGAAATLVPGAVGGWLEALERYGSLDRATVFGPAITYADRGFPITAKLARWFERSVGRLAACPFARAQFLDPDGQPPRPGSLLRQPNLATTYRAIVEDGVETFYRRAIAQAVLEYVATHGGWLTADDLTGYAPAWQTPLEADYADWRVLTPPPPCAGVQTLETLAILRGLALTEPHDPEYLHMLIEAIKLARADRVQASSDARRRVAEAYVADLRGRIDPRLAAPCEGDRFTGASSFTTSFCVADAEGTLVSCTQSLGQLFGAAAVAGETGLLLNDFLWWFDDDPRSPNRLAPAARLDMCLAPVVAVRQDGARLAVATPGSNGIAQTTAQMLLNVLEFQMTPQAAIEAPRLVSLGQHPFIDPFGPPRAPTLLAIEDRVPLAAREELTRRGHVLEDLGGWSNTVGAGVAIVRHSGGVLEGGADPRRDSQVCAW